MSTASVSELRDAIVASTPIDTSSHGRAPEPGHVYVPPSHVNALRLDRDLVIGTRGVGKSFWTQALASQEIRATLGNTIDDLTSLDVAVGFGERPDLDAYPNGETFEKLIGDGKQPYDIWKAVLARWLAGKLQERIPDTCWLDSVEWTRNEPEAHARLLERAEQRFADQGRQALLVFDALDRSSHDWPTMDRITRDLLRVMLTMKPYRRLHCKAFLREDQFVDRQVSDFPDASKLLANRIELTWEPHDLHGLLWQYLGNGPGRSGEILRAHFRTILPQMPTTASTGPPWRLPNSVRRDIEAQRRLFASLAGESMGRDRRRGIPYTWVVGHLADGKGRTSPRSFLAAIRNAAEDTRDRYPEHPLPLHYESLKRGVQKASEIRVGELAEDYPWISRLLEPLRGLVVPCEFASIAERWREPLARGEVLSASNRLPPEHYAEGPDGIKRDLEKLGVFQTMRDRRLNMPDLYRVGFGLGRRGGVKPVKAKPVD